MLAVLSGRSDLHLGRRQLAMAQATGRPAPATLKRNGTCRVRRDIRLRKMNGRRPGRGIAERDDIRIDAFALQPVFEHDLRPNAFTLVSRGKRPPARHPMRASFPDHAHAETRLASRTTVPNSA